MRATSLIMAGLLLTEFGFPARAATVAVDQAGQRFSEKAIAAAVGDTVVFQNSDTVRHNIRIVDDNDEVQDLGLQQPGERLVYKVDKAGRFRARCGIHPSMKMTINVK